MTKRKTGSRSLGMFRGVFVPTFLTIMGVILFLRLGRIVGEAGLLGSIAIVLLAVSVTICTGLSLSSITTTIKIGAGGAFSIISKTMGLEIGGSVGIPLYLAQTFSVVLYIFGFGEAWKFLFPDHPTVIIVYAAFILIFLLTFINVKYALNAQILVFILVILSLVSAYAGGNWWLHHLQVPMIGSFEEMGFWALFALFFPAVTGLMAGVGMSGELTNPRKQIPRGVMLGLGITAVLYLVTIFWLGYSTGSETLTDNLVMVKLAFFSPLVLAGILAATFSSALTTFVAAPRLLQALGNNGVLMFNKVLAKKTKKGEPIYSTMITALIIAGALAIGSLDSIAPVLTMFFLITYALINVVVLIEHSMGFVSFRPTFKIPRFVPLIGVLISVVVMFYINLISGLIAIALMIIVYLALVKRKLETKAGYVRSGLLIGVAEWAARKAITLAESPTQIWKPNILLPALTSGTLLGNFHLVKAIIYPNGSLSVLGMKLKKQSPEKHTKLKKGQEEQELESLPSLVNKFGREGIFTSYTQISAEEYVDAVCLSFQAMGGQFFRPNILVIPVSPENLGDRQIKKLFKTAKQQEAGLVFFDKDEYVGLGSEEDIHVWIPNEALEKDLYNGKIYDLAMLIAYRLQQNWIGTINLWMNLDKKKKDEAQHYLRKLKREARFPPSTEINVAENTFIKALRAAPKGDVHIIPVKGAEHIIKLRKSTKKIDKTILFVFDSEKEDVLA